VLFVLCRGTLNSPVKEAAVDLGRTIKASVLGSSVFATSQNSRQDNIDLRSYITRKRNINTKLWESEIMGNVDFSMKNVRFYLSTRLRQTLLVFP
jgi:hypothetical protein